MLKDALDLILGSPHLALAEATARGVAGDYLLTVRAPLLRFQKCSDEQPDRPQNQQQ